MSAAKPDAYYDSQDRSIYVYPRDNARWPNTTAKVTFAPGVCGGIGLWTAVELDEFGGFKARMFDGRRS